MRLFVITELCALLISSHLAFNAIAEWKNLIELNVPEGKLEDPVIYSEFPLPTGDEEYTLLYAQKGDSLYEVYLFQVSEIGVVTTVQPLIYERGKANQYDLTIVRRSSKKTNGGLAATVRVTVQDANIFPPAFPISLYNGTIKENSPEGTVVLGLENCHAEDRDESGIKTYKIIKGNERGYLKVEKYDVGEKSFLRLLATNRLIKRGKATPFITLVVEAEDMRVPPLTARTTIGVKVEEVNDHTPVFNESSYEQEISEDIRLGRSIMKVQATDKDEGTSGEVYYFFQTLSSFFTINVFTGVITLVRELDYSQSAQRLHRLTVIARDAGIPFKQASATVKITISKDIPNYPFPASSNSDQQNTSPFFREAPCHFTIYTSFPVKASLGPIYASDDDLPGPNKELRYFLGSPSSQFSLDTYSGVLTLKNELVVQTYSLVVRAEDQGSPKKTAEAQVKIKVRLADNPNTRPSFSNPVQAITVAEDTELGKSVFRASANPGSSSSKGVVYSAIFGSAMPYFELDEKTGVLKTAAPLDREKHAEYDLMIEARNEEKIPRHANLYLVIYITDVDDSYPDFNKPVYNASVPERNPKGTFVTVIHAIDRDSASVTYDVSSSSEFKIEANTGVIRTKKELDRASGDRRFLLYVTATDGTGKTSTAIVNIGVTSAHDSAPKFISESYKVSVREGQGMVPNLLCIAATGSNGAVKYSIKPGGPTGKFKINEITGTLSVQKSFNYKFESSGYRFQVEAKDESFPKASTASVTVLITNEDGPPIFTKKNYDVTTVENVASGTTLLASDDIGGKGAFRFSVEEDKSSSDFECTLDDIKTTDVIDHFRVSRVGWECQLTVIKNFIQLSTREFKFQVRVANTLQRNLFGTAGVTVKVTETDDHLPEFTQSSYWVSVASDTPSGTSLLRVTATDKDNPRKSDFVYNLQPKERFQIDSQGVVRTASTTLPENGIFNLKVTAKETGNSKVKEIEVPLKISVHSTPFVAVEFNSPSYRASLPEDSPVDDSTVFTASASLPGSEAGTLQYSIVGGNFDSTFKINSANGKVTLAKSLDYETVKSFKLIIRAIFKFSDVSSPDVTAETEGMVTITDINDNSPRFLVYQSPTKIAIEGYTPSTTEVMQVRATDEDTGPSGSVTYSIYKPGSVPAINIPFSIDLNTGVIRTNREIIFSERQVYSLVVRAEDGGGRISATTIDIAVLDINKPPTFSQDEYVKTISENSKVGTSVIDVAAVYDDSAALLKYSIIQGNLDNKFCIDYLGIIGVAQPLDREKVPSYELSVMVSLDNKNDTTVVKVTLRDANDHAPSFGKSIVEIEIPENQAVNSNLKLLTATDQDKGENGRVTYSILQTVRSDSTDLFAIDSNTGMVTLEKSLNHEKAAKHILFIMAQDNATPKLSDMVKLIIRVTDINDNLPRFSTSSYQASIPADAKQGDRVVQLSATDLDSGLNSLIYYKIAKGNKDDIFAINSANGLITLGRKSLASAATDTFTLTVEACDENDRNKKDEAKVLVNVFLPDGPPKYPDPSLSFDVDEGIPARRTFLSVPAATTEHVIYQILSGNEDGVIKIDQFSGDLVTAEVLDREKSPQYKLHVIARDLKGRTAEVEITINLKDDNDNDPFFIDLEDSVDDSGDGLMEYKVEAVKAGEVVIRLQAYDLDNEASLEYRLSAEAEAFFTIDNQGFLRAKRTLEDSIPGKRSTDPLSTLSFKVTATDGATPPNSVTAPVRLAFARYQASEEALAARVRENTRVGKVVAVVPKYIPGGKFSILYPEKSHFTVDQDGKVKLAKELDFESRVAHALTVREEGLTSTGPIVNDINLELSVVDVNDNNPRFQMRPRHGRVNGNSRAGAVAFQLQVSDPDYGPNGLAGYQLLTANIPFGVNPEDDTIVVDNPPLTESQFDIELLPFDYGIPRLENLPVKVRVDVSQSPPRFIDFHDDGYRFEVPEDAKVGTTIGKIEAVSASGSRLGYTILKGDPEKKFKITGNGEVRLNSLLDYETQAMKYELLVQAIELITMGLASKVKVKVSVLNANDHYPEFESGSYTKTISEDWPIGNSILTVRATDGDCGQDGSCPQEHLEYSVQNNEYFAVDPDTGVISPARSLDFESQKIHIFQVQVSDTLGKVSHVALAYVNITVTDSNDNAPLFDNSEYRFSVYEDSPVGTGIGVLAVEDADQDDITYTIIAGSGPFQVDSKTGIISVKQSIPSTPLEYTYTVRARDPDGQYGDTRVIISIKDENNNRPVFEKCEDSKVRENLPPGQLVTQVLATDKDPGKNGEVDYRIVNTDQRSFFKIDHSTGVLTSIIQFDREDRPEYIVVIAAEDGGEGRPANERLLRYCTLKVTIEDENDNYPDFKIKTYTGSVLRNAPVGTSILTVHAYDRDSDENKKVEYTLSPDDLLTISDRGVVSTKVSLKSFTGTMIISSVVASNTEPMTVGDVDPASRSARIEIYISDLQPPKFTKQIYTTTLTENEPTGNTVLQIKAVSQNQVRYQILSDNRKVQNDREYFNINPDTGLITTGGKVIDYEEHSVFRMQFLAKDTITDLISTCLVLINVTDVNDNSPIFGAAWYEGRVLENSPPNTEVLRVYAHDVDTGDGGKVTYFIDPSSPYFTIDRDTGVIRTTQTFDREIKDQERFLITCVARNKGNSPHERKVGVEIIVVDDNDNGPLFSPTAYSLDVKEDVPVGKVVYEFTVKDSDSGANTKAEFYISDGNQAHAFHLTTEGKLAVDNKLDYETTKEYKLEIIAMDGRRTSQPPASLTIKVLDVDDNAPVFTQLRYDGSVLEGTPADKLVLTVTATDVDTPLNSIYYSLDQLDEMFFTIGPRTGELRTSGRLLDREKTPVLYFDVKASDRKDGKRKGVAGIKIVVLDINDEAPYFPNPPYIGTIEENKPPGTSVIVVQAVDEDDPNVDGGHTDLTYSLDDDSNGRFVIDKDSGLITNTMTFDREGEPNEYNITVRATDKAVNPLSGTTLVTVRVEDANDHRPKFNPLEYTASVPENAYPAFFVTKVDATDEDIGYNSRFEFTIVSGNEPYAFYIKPATGEILVSGELDYETKPSYTLKINVSDQGMPQQTSLELATVLITILDANDHPPVFQPDEYTISIKEDAAIGTPLLSLVTTDIDKAIQTKLWFTVVLGDPANIFEVRPDPNNPSVGILYNTASLDRETVDGYILEIQAEDADGLFATCVVIVTVLDVNDNGPHFVPPLYFGSIVEKTKASQFVVKLNSYDPDEPSNGPPFDYKILNGTVNGNFYIEPSSKTSTTAEIYSLGSYDFSYEVKREWKLWVQVTDSGNPAMSNITVVYIEVKDSENNNEPFNATMTIILNAFHGHFEGGDIGKVYYRDNDFEVDENGYKILNQNPGVYFNIDPNSGQLSVQRDIPMGNYGLFVHIKEKSRKDSSKLKDAYSAVNVNVRNISETTVSMSTTVQFVNIHEQAILVGDYYNKLQETLKEIYQVDDVFIFSIQTDLENLQAINVQFSVGNMPSIEVLVILNEKRASFAKIGLTIGALGIDSCAKETNKTGICQNVVKAYNTFTVISGYYGQFPAPDSSLTFVSIDVQLEAEYSPIFKSQIMSKKRCADEPCLNDGICHDVKPDGFICQCKHKSKGLVPGPLCEETTRTFDRDLGKSYIWLHTLAAYERNVVTLEFMTIVAEGLILYQGPLLEVGLGESRDFMAIVLYGGFIRVVISLGAQPLTLTVSRGPRLDDGEWHHVEVRQELKLYFDR